MGCVVSGFAGIGKTTVAEKYNTIIDLESSDYKWIYDTDYIKHLNKEERKGRVEKSLNLDWPFNYIDDIIKMSEKYAVVLISMDTIVRNILISMGVDVLVFYPSLSSKNIIIERYKQRKNGDLFINLFMTKYEEWVLELEQCINSFELAENEFCEDKLKELKIIK